MTTEKELEKRIKDLEMSYDAFYFYFVNICNIFGLNRNWVDGKEVIEKGSDLKYVTKEQRLLDVDRINSFIDALGYIYKKTPAIPEGGEWVKIEK